VRRRLLQMLDDGGGVLAEYCSISLAARRLGCSNGQLSQCVKGVVAAVKGMRFVRKFAKPGDLQRGPTFEQLAAELWFMRGGSSAAAPQPKAESADEGSEDGGSAETPALSRSRSSSSSSSSNESSNESDEEDAAVAVLRIAPSAPPPPPPESELAAALAASRARSAVLSAERLRLEAKVGALEAALDAQQASPEPADAPAGWWPAPRGSSKRADDDAAADAADAGSDTDACPAAPLARLSNAAAVHGELPPAPVSAEEEAFYRSLARPAVLRDWKKRARLLPRERHELTGAGN
jgi:hypothetical protein